MLRGGVDEWSLETRFLHGVVAARYQHDLKSITKTTTTNKNYMGTTKHESPEQMARLAIKGQRKSHGKCWFRTDVEGSQIKTSIRVR